MLLGSWTELLLQQRVQNSRFLLLHKYHGADRPRLPLPEQTCGFPRLPCTVEASRVVATGEDLAVVAGPTEVTFGWAGSVDFTEGSAEEA